MVEFRVTVFLIFIFGLPLFGVFCGLYNEHNKSEECDRLLGDGWMYDGLSPYDSERGYIVCEKPIHDSNHFVVARDYMTIKYEWWK